MVVSGDFTRETKKGRPLRSGLCRSTPGGARTPNLRFRRPPATGCMVCFGNNLRLANPFLSFDLRSGVKLRFGGGWRGGTPPLRLERDVAARESIRLLVKASEPKGE